MTNKYTELRVLPKRQSYSNNEKGDHYYTTALSYCYNFLGVNYYMIGSILYTSIDRV
jgi:hypothetical protein